MTIFSFSEFLPSLLIELYGIETRAMYAKITCDVLLIELYGIETKLKDYIEVENVPLNRTIWN